MEREDRNIEEEDNDPERKLENPQEIGWYPEEIQGI